MRNRKGAGAIVAWVLLLGFSIGLAVTISMWATRQTEEMSERSTRFVEGGMQCDNVMINVASAENNNCVPSATCCLKLSGATQTHK